MRPQDSESNKATTAVDAPTKPAIDALSRIHARTGAWNLVPFRVTGAGIDRAVSIALFIAAVSMLAFYIAVTYRAQFHSDAAMKLLLAEQMAKQFTLFPRDWSYVNDIPIIFASLIAAPLSWFFSPSFPLHAFVDAVAASLVLYAAYVAARAVGIEGPLRWWVPTLLASSLSTDFAEKVFGQSAYSGLLFTLLLLAGWGARYLDSSTNRSAITTKRNGLAGICALILVSVAAGPRGLATYAVPVLLATTGFYVIATTDSSGQRTRALRLGICVGAATIGGAIFFLLLLFLLRFNSGAIAQTFPDSARISNHLHLLVRNWFELFDALPPGGSKFNVVWAGIYAARLGFALIAAFLPLLLLLRVVSLRSPTLRFLVLLHASVLASTCYLLVFTGVMVNETDGSPRYLIPLIPTTLLIIAVWLQAAGRIWRINASRVGWIMTGMMLVLSPLQLVAPAFSQWSAINQGLRSNPRASVLTVLQKAGLHRGFATYWDANIFSVLSGGDVRIAPIALSDGSIPVPHHHLSSDQWYAADWAHGPTFLLLDSTDTRELNRPALESQLGAPTNILHVNGYDVLIYPFNLGERLGFSAQSFVHLPSMTPATCAADLVALEDRLVLQPNAFGTMHVRATNRSNSLWSQDSIPRFNPAVRIMAANGVHIAEPRAPLPYSVKPGESVVLSLPFRAPSAGDYTLSFSFVAEGDAWCGDVTGNWVKVPLSVKP